MEDGLGQKGVRSWNPRGRCVLILVLMEDGLGHYERNYINNRKTIVLILVLMEDGLGYFIGGAEAHLVIVS